MLLILLCNGDHEGLPTKKKYCPQEHEDQKQELQRFLNRQLAMGFY